MIYINKGKTLLALRQKVWKRIILQDGIR
jgi:hypothetical protein